MNAIMKTNQTCISPHSVQRARSWRVWPALAGAAMALAVAILSPASALAADFNWGLTNSGASGNWSAGASWLGGAVPTGSDNAVVLSTNGNFTITVDVSTNIQNLTYSHGPI